MGSWHPVQQLFRTVPGERIGLDPNMGAWGIVRELRFGDEVWYRAVTYAPRSEDRELVGYSLDVRALAMRLYRHHLATRSSAPPFPGYPTVAYAVAE